MLNRLTSVSPPPLLFSSPDSLHSRSPPLTTTSRYYGEDPVYSIKHDARVSIHNAVLIAKSTPAEDKGGFEHASLDLLGRVQVRRPRYIIHIIPVKRNTYAHNCFPPFSLTLSET